MTSSEEFSDHACQVMMLLDKRLVPGHFIRFLGTLHGSQHGGVKAMYDSLQASSDAGAAERASGSGDAEQPDSVAATHEECVGAGDAAHASSVPVSSTGPADVQPAAPRRDAPLRRAEKALAKLTATLANLSAKHADAEDPFHDHAASICNAANGQLLQLGAASLVDSPGALAFVSNPDAPPGLSKQRLRPFISPKKKSRGKAKGSTPLAAESSPVKPVAARFFVPVKCKSSLLEEVGKQQTAGMQKKAEQAEIRARATLHAAKQPQSGTAPVRALAEIGVSNAAATGTENKDTAIKVPSSQQQPQAVASPQPLLPRPDLTACSPIANASEHARNTCMGIQGAASSSPALVPASQPLPASAKQSDTGMGRKRRRVQPTWLRESVKEF